MDREFQSRGWVCREDRLRRTAFHREHALNSTAFGWHYGQAISPSLLVAVVYGGQGIVWYFMNRTGIQFAQYGHMLCLEDTLQQ